MNFIDIFCAVLAVVAVLGTFCGVIALVLFAGTSNDDFHGTDDSVYEMGITLKPKSK